LHTSLDFTEDLLFFDSLWVSIEERTELAYISLLADLLFFSPERDVPRAGKSACSKADSVWTDD